MLSLAVANYHDRYDCFPPAYIADANGRPMHSWRVLILPYIDEQQLYARYDFSEPWNGPNNSKLLPERPRTYTFNDESLPGTDTNYLAVIGDETMWPFERTVEFDSVFDGPSNTIHFVENVGSGISWMEPRDLHLDTMSFTLQDSPVNGISSWLHPPGIVTANGIVRALDLKTTEGELLGMLKIADGRGLGLSTKEMEDGRKRQQSK